MKPAAIGLLLLCIAPAWALSPAAAEFLAIVKQLEPLHCEKRNLRREITLGEVQGKDVKALKDRFAALDRDPSTAKLERRLAQLEPRVSASSDPEDLAAISLEQRKAFYRCE